MEMLDNYQVKIKVDNKIDYISRHEILDIEVPLDFFTEYGTDFWVFNPLSNELELVANPEEMKAIIEAETENRISIYNLEVRKQELLTLANEARAKAMYSNITMPFPVDEHEIQFRNDADRMNITNKVQGATALVISGAGTALMSFTTADDVVVQMTASEMLSAGMVMLEAKDQVFYDFKVVKDAIRNATTMAELDLVDLSLLTTA